ncbi:9287_t:CDS:2 [Entrophospora sp. SA101]|nr:9045_t:CDS:2 [Entrophospora sp. SA101]CAJ0850084.1 9287_t:CDS:2 [Entrophospora sp. SA101]
MNPFNKTITNNFIRNYVRKFKSIQSNKRHLSTNSSNQNNYKEIPFSKRLKEAWNKTEIKWYPIPIGIGIGVIALQQSKHIYEREKSKREEEIVNDSTISPRKKSTIVGPLQVCALPLRAISRLWGKLNNEYDLPVWARVPVYKLYSWLFDCNLSEIENTNLKSYPNLGSFFCRSLKSGVRPIDDSDLVSPADGEVVMFGLVKEDKLEQIKGKAYSLGAFLGKKNHHKDNDVTTTIHEVEVDNVDSINEDIAIIDENEFANVNGITYSLDTLLGDDLVDSKKQESSIGDDASIVPNNSSKNSDGSSINNESKEEIVAKSVLWPISPIHGHHFKEESKLYFCVVYLAPGDYHKFHSPTNWVVEYRRHFAGELYSVSPYMLRILTDLFVLNERVVLLGRWKHGFFSMTPVGATNVGSIKINFDKALCTNKGEDLTVGTYTEASYRKASKLLGGQPLRTGDEIGGFQLGSTIVLVFEAPDNFNFSIKPGQKIKFGQKLGNVS